MQNVLPHVINGRHSAIFLGTILSSFGCESTEESQILEPTVNLTTFAEARQRGAILQTLQFGRIGKLHNQGLGEVYGQFTIFDINLTKFEDQLVDYTASSSVSRDSLGLTASDYTTMLDAFGHGDNMFPLLEIGEQATILRTYGISASDRKGLEYIIKVIRKPVSTPDEIYQNTVEIDEYLARVHPHSTYLQQTFDIYKASVQYWTSNLDSWLQLQVVGDSYVPLKAGGCNSWSWFWDVVNVMGERDFVSGSFGVAWGFFVGGPGGAGAVGVASALYGSGASGLWEVIKCTGQ
ncbi:hypothetical protein [Neolewinella sp.]|uniref:hypothetical protein n=1 Tax=Neolewinella sp. TaxID=2993543 RepID=UPI003B5257AD